MSDATGYLSDRRKPFVMIENAALSLRNNEFKVYAAIISFASFQTRAAWPSLRAIAQRARMGKSSVVASIAKLEQCGLIQVQRERLEGGRDSVNHYQVFDPSQVPDFEARLARVYAKAKPADDGAAATDARAVDTRADGDMGLSADPDGSEARPIWVSVQTHMGLSTDPNDIQVNDIQVNERKTKRKRKTTPIPDNISTSATEGGSDDMHLSTGMTAVTGTTDKSNVTAGPLDNERSGAASGDIKTKRRRLRLTAEQRAENVRRLDELIAATVEKMRARERELYAQLPAKLEDPNGDGIPF